MNLAYIWQNYESLPGCKTPVSDKSKTFQEDEKTVYFSIRVTKKTIYGVNREA